MGWVCFATSINSCPALLRKTTRHLERPGALAALNVGWVCFATSINSCPALLRKTTRHLERFLALAASNDELFGE